MPTLEESPQSAVLDEALLKSAVPKSDNPRTDNPDSDEGKLSDTFKKTLEKKRSEVAQPEPESAKAERLVKKEADKPADTKADAPKEDKPVVEKKKAASPLEAVMEVKPDAKAEPAADEEIPATAPVKQLREAYERSKSELVHLKAELAKKSQPDPAINAKLETLQQERDRLAAENAELRDGIVAVNVEYDPAFQTKYVKGRAALFDKATAVVEQYGGDPKAFAEAMTLTGRARTAALREALSEVDEMDRHRITSRIDAIEQLDEEKAELLKNPQQSFEKLTAAQQEKQLAAQAEAEKNRVETLNRTLRALPSKHPLFRESPADIEGADKWNERLKSDLEKSNYYLTEASSDEVSEAAAKAARFDFVESEFLSYRQTAQAEIDGLKAELAKYENSSPGFNGNRKPAGPSNMDKTPGQLWRESLEAKRHAKEV